MSNPNHALVVFSGGQDSTTCLGWALKHFEKVTAITFLYGQKHAVELMCAERICKKHNVPQHVIEMGFFAQIADSALLRGSEQDVCDNHTGKPGLPASFVPNRNAAMITVAHALAQKIDAGTLVLGVCETDFSGYPDCRSDFIERMQLALNLGSDSAIAFATPLMWINKAETFKLAEDVGILEDVLEMSHTCYNGNHDKADRHEWGYGCGVCPACQLRARGYAEFVALPKG